MTFYKLTAKTFVGQMGESTPMIILYVLSFLGCLLIAIILLRIIIWCFFNDNLVGHRLSKSSINAASNGKCSSMQSFSEQGMLQTVTTLENILLQVRKYILYYIILKYLLAFILYYIILHYTSFVLYYIILYIKVFILY